VILAINKWDTQKNNPKFTKEMAADKIRKKMAYLRYAPMMFVSAKQGKGLGDLGDLAEEILHQRKLKIPTHEFSEWIKRESLIHNPMNAKFYMSHQSGRNPPTFVCHVNDPDKVHFSLRRHFMNALREKWGYMGTPVRLLFVKAESDRKFRPAAKSQGRKGDKARKPKRAY
jgi:GTP-binding protein